MHPFLLHFLLQSVAAPATSEWGGGGNGRDASDAHRDRLIKTLECERGFRKLMFCAPFCKR